MSADIEQRVRTALSGLPGGAELLECDPDFADTADFCRHYGYSPEICANTIVVKPRDGSGRFAACVLLASTRLDVNHTVRKRFGVRKVRFADAGETRELTGMMIGGVTPLALPADLPVWVDSRVMACSRIILGGGSRSLKLLADPQLLTTLPGSEVVEGLARDAPPPG